MTEITAEALATVDDLAVRMPELDLLGGSDDSPDVLRAEALLEDASNLVRSAGDAAWTDETCPPAVRSVVLGATARAWENPTGLSAEQMGNYSYTAPGGLFLTVDELGIVRRAARRLGIFTQPTTRSDNDVPDVPSVLGYPVADTWSNLGQGD